MKKIIQFVAFLTLLLLAFSSCSGGSSGGGSSDDGDDSPSLFGTYSGTIDSINYSVTLESDNSYNSIDGVTSYKGTYTVNGNAITLHPTHWRSAGTNDAWQTVDGDYSINLTYSGGNIVWHVAEDLSGILTKQ